MEFFRRKSNAKFVIIGVAVIVLLTVLIVFLVKHDDPDSKAAGGDVTKAAEATAQPSKEPVTSSPTVTPTPKPDGFVYNELVFPEYIQDFLKDGQETDYMNVLTALYTAKSEVTLTAVKTQEEADTFLRSVRIAFPMNQLLYDGHYYLGEGPFSFDEESCVLTIRYGYEEAEPNPEAPSKEAYLSAVAYWEQIVTEAFTDNVTFPLTEERTAMELYEYVAGHVYYVLDMTMTMYDAMLRGNGYCQTYSELYQFLMWQAGYECALYCAPDVEHEWNMIWINGNSYHVDTTWQSTSDVSEYYYFGMSDSHCELSGHGDQNTYFDADALLDGEQIQSICTDRKYDEAYREDME